MYPEKYLHHAHDLAHLVHLNVIKNIKKNGDNLASITADLANDGDIVNLYARIPADDGRIAWLENEVLSKLSKEFVNASKGEARSFFFTLASPSKVDEDFIKAVDAESIFYYNQQEKYADVATPAASQLASLAHSTNIIMNEYALALAHAQPELKRAPYSDGELEYVVHQSGVSVPSLRNFDFSRIFTYGEREAVRSAIRLSTSHAVLSQKTVLFGPDSFDLKLAGKLKAIFDANPEAARQFFDASAFTSECAVGTAHFATP